MSDEMVKVILYASDASQDYMIPAKRAKQLLKEGKLCRDLTNGEYCTPTNKRVE
jgi:hypothetical protein